MKNIYISAAAALLAATAIPLCAQTGAPAKPKPVPAKAAAARQQPAPAVKTQQPAAAPKAQQPAPVSPFDQAVEKLSSPEPATRRQGADFLAQSRDPKAKPYLLKALKDDSPQVRIAAVDGLGMQSARDAVPQLCEALTADKESPVRQAAAISLAYILDPAAGPALVKALKDPVPGVRFSAANTLGAMRYADAEKPLIDMLDESELSGRQVVVRALGAMQSAAAGPRIAKMLSDENKYLRTEAARALGFIAYRPAAEDLKKALRAEEDPALRIESAVALSKMGDKSGLETAYSFARSADPGLRGQALNVIANIGDESSLKMLNQMYSEESDQGVKGMIDFTRQRLEVRLKRQQQK